MRAGTCGGQRSWVFWKLDLQMVLSHICGCYEPDSALCKSRSCSEPANLSHISSSFIFSLFTASMNKAAPNIKTDFSNAI